MSSNSKQNGNTSKQNGNNGLRLIESLENGEQKVYNSVFVEHQHVNILSNDLALQIVSKLAQTKACAMDLSRELNQHEQKIYYYLRKLETAGVIKKVGTERRFGMIAKMYSAVSPIVATKLYDDGSIITSNNGGNTHLHKLLNTFVENGKLNAKIVVGDTYPHGKYNKPDLFSLFLIDFFLALGSKINNLNSQSYEIDVFIKKSDLEENNIILIGNNMSNTIIESVNDKIPVHFTDHETIKSKITNKEYNDPRIGVIIKCDNPFNKNKGMLLIGGTTCRSMRAVNTALLSGLKEISDHSNFYMIVEGLDKNGDGIIDDAKILEHNGL